MHENRTVTLRMASMASFSAFPRLKVSWYACRVALLASDIACSSWS